MKTHYTFLGTATVCGTANGRRSTSDWSKVTCARCLAGTVEQARRDEAAKRLTSDDCEGCGGAMDNDRVLTYDFDGEHIRYCDHCSTAAAEDLGLRVLNVVEG